MNLSDLLKDNKLRKITPDSRQAADCLAAAERDIKAAKAMLGSDCDWAFSIAYNAVLQSARALMFSEGFRAAGEDQHKAAVEFADAKLGAKMRDSMDFLGRMRLKRHQAVYEKSGAISRFEAEHAIKTSEEILAKVKEKLGKK